MIKVTSNLDAVIGRFERRVERIPAAMTAALAPGQWREQAVTTAERVLAGIPKQPGEEKFVPVFVKQIYVTLFEGGLLIGLRAPDSKISLVAAQLTLPGEASPVAELKLDGVEAEAQFEQMLNDWVENEKRWNPEVDGPKTPEDIRSKAQFIFTELLKTSDFKVVQEGPNAGRTVRDAFMPHILEYIADLNEKQGEANGLDPVTASIWLTAVLAAWSKLVRDGYRAKVKAELKRNAKN